MTSLSLRLGLPFCCVGLLLLGVAPTAQASQTGVYVDVKESEAPDARVIERWKLYGSSYALVIGINEYSGNWPRLSNAIKDAELVAEALEERGFEVTLKTNLTSTELTQTLKTFYAIKGADPEARLVVWFAGHGFSRAGEGYLVPSDAESPSKPEFYIKALPMRDFGSLVRLAKAKHAIAIFDSCFAGSIFNTQRSKPPAAITEATKKPVRQFLTSGDVDQEVSDDGTFRRLFIDALDGEEMADANGDGYLTGAELSFYLEDRLTNLTQNQQTPRSGRLRDPRFDRGDFVFVLPKKQAALAKEEEQETQTDAQPATHSDAAFELAFWNAIKDSNNPQDYQDYVEQYPSGRFVSLARRRAKDLQITTESEMEPEEETQQAALTPAETSTPELQIAKRNERYVAIKRSNVRAGPSTDNEKIALLVPGKRVTVTGDVVDMPWLQITMDDGRRGFVYAPLVEEEQRYNQRLSDVARKQAEDKREREAEERRKQALLSLELPSQQAEQPSASSTAAAPAAANLSNEAIFWSTIEDSSDPNDFQEFLLRFPAGTFATQAKRRMASLNEQQANLPLAENVTAKPDLLLGTWTGTTLRDTSILRPTSYPKVVTITSLSGGSLRYSSQTCNGTLTVKGDGGRPSGDGESIVYEFKLNTDGLLCADSDVRVELKGDQSRWHWRGWTLFGTAEATANLTRSSQ